MSKAACVCPGYDLDMLAPLTADRIPEALALMERFYTELELEFVPERARQALQQLPGWGGWWFLQDEGETAGYFVLTIGYSLEFGGRFALLDEFFVERAHRGEGLGAKAMPLILREAAALAVQALHLEAEGEVMRFYERYGFRPRGREMMTVWL